MWPSRRAKIAEFRPRFRRQWLWQQGGGTGGVAQTEVLPTSVQVGKVGSKSVMLEATRLLALTDFTDFTDFTDLNRVKREIAKPVAVFSWAIRARASGRKNAGKVG